MDGRFYEMNKDTFFCSMIEYLLSSYIDAVDGGIDISSIQYLSNIDNVIGYDGPMKILNL